MVLNATNLMGITKDMVLPISDMGIKEILGILLIISSAVIAFKKAKDWHYKRFQQKLCPDLLESDDIKLCINRWSVKFSPPTVSLKYTQQDHKEWHYFKREMDWQFKRLIHPRRWGLYKKAEKATNKFNKLVGAAHKLLAFRIDLILKETNLEIWDGTYLDSNGKIVYGSREYIYSSNALSSIIISYMIRCEDENWSCEIYVRSPEASDEIFALKVKGPGELMGQAESREELEKIRDLLQPIVDDKKTIKRAKRIIKANQKMGEAVKKYNVVLAEILEDINMYPCVRVRR